MFIIRYIPEQKKITDDSPDLSDTVTEIAYSMLKSFTPQMGITIEGENILVYYYITVDIFVAKCRDLHVINVKEF